MSSTSWLATSPSTDVLDLDGIPFVDHHCHPWLREWQRQDALAFRTCFSESPSQGLARDHLPWSLPYRRALRELASLLGCEPNEEAILGIRQSLSADAYLNKLFHRAGIRALFLDDGYPPPDEASTLGEIATATRLPVGRVLRVETLVQDQTAAVASFDELLSRFDDAVGNVTTTGALALKTIAAYRSGLRLAPVHEADAAAAWLPLREQAIHTGSVRIASKPVVDFFALRAIAHAARQGAPVQIHTGYGDPDLDLREANPLHLRPVLEEAAYRGANLVLLHGAYPYTREAAYLAAVYPQVYLDVSTSLPPLGATELIATLSQALAVAPASKLLLSSDAARIPEHHALGARAARGALARSLTALVVHGDIDTAEAASIAEWPLWRTSEVVYGEGLTFIRPSATFPQRGERPS